MQNYQTMTNQQAEDFIRRWLALDCEQELQEILNAPLRELDFLNKIREPCNHDLGFVRMEKKEIQMKPTPKSPVTHSKTMAQKRLHDARVVGVPWKKWGPYLRMATPCG